MKKTITAHCLVKNEARFIWYSVMSVIKHVDNVLLYDTGSTDGTQDIIREIKKADKENKVLFKEYGTVTPQTFPLVRQEMLEKTQTDWFIVVDGDEIWWEDSIRRVVLEIKSNGDKLESIVVPTINLVGDIYHYQEEAAGNYNLAGKKGHYNLRAVNKKIPGLHSSGEHGVWGWVDEEKKMIQDRDVVAFVNSPYLHATHLPRAMEQQGEHLVPKRYQKLKHEIGIEFPSDFYYPEVLFRPRPKAVPSVWLKMQTGFKVRAYLETPLRKLKRRIFPRRVGY